MGRGKVANCLSPNLAPTTSAVLHPPSSACFPQSISLINMPTQGRRTILLHPTYDELAAQLEEQREAAAHATEKYKNLKKKATNQSKKSQRKKHVLTRLVTPCCIC
jgi:hypothetical protein